MLNGIIEKTHIISSTTTKPYPTKWGRLKKIWQRQQPRVEPKTHIISSKVTKFIWFLGYYNFFKMNKYYETDEVLSNLDYEIFDNLDWDIILSL